jgi:hypothetical protein
MTVYGETSFVIGCNLATSSSFQSILVNWSWSCRPLLCWVQPPKGENLHQFTRTKNTAPNEIVHSVSDWLLECCMLLQVLIGYSIFRNNLWFPYFQTCYTLKERTDGFHERTHKELTISQKVIWLVLGWFDNCDYISESVLTFFENC